LAHDERASSCDAFRSSGYAGLAGSFMTLLALDKPRRRAFNCPVSAISLRCCPPAFVSRAPGAGRRPAASGKWTGQSSATAHPCLSTLNSQPSTTASRGQGQTGCAKLGLRDLSLTTCGPTAHTSSRARAPTSLSAQPPARHRPSPTAWFSASSDRNYPIHSIWRLRHDFPMKPPNPDVLPVLGQTSGQPYCWTDMIDELVHEET